MRGDGRVGEEGRPSACSSVFVVSGELEFWFI